MSGMTGIMPKVEMLGTIDVEKLKAEKARWLEDNVARINAEYGMGEDFGESEFMKVRRYEEEKAECGKCAGLPCKKSRTPTFQTVLKIDVARRTVEESLKLCKYEKARREKEKIKRNFKSAKISTDYLNKTFADYEVDVNNKKAVEVAKKILKGEERGAYFYGAFGTGKTMLAAIIAQESMKKGVGVLFYKVPFLVKDLQEAMFDKVNPMRESELLKQICEVPMLILDDFGMSGKISTYAAGRLSMIIDARYENSKKQTIITSNLTLKKLQEKLDNPSDAVDDYTLDGSRIADRLKEMCEIAKFEGESRRLKK